eukprot:2445322-Rhodomonas_salina.4
MESEQRQCQHYATHLADLRCDEVDVDVAVACRLLVVEAGEETSERDREEVREMEDGRMEAKIREG